MAASGPDDKAARLARMKRLALCLLGLAAALYALATWMQPRQPGWAVAWGYAAAFAEAAMVGAMADWFAVVALFRHPLGLPIPHTAIVPRNQARIGENLAAFICDHFLGTQQVLEKIRSFDPAGRLAAWLTDPAHAQQVGNQLVAAARYGLQAMDDTRVQGFVRRTVLDKLGRVDVSALAGRLLEMLTSDRRHQALLDELLQRLALKLEDDALQAEIAERIAGEIKLLRIVGLDQMAGKVATKKLIAGIVKLIGEMGEDAEHPMRLRFDAFVSGFVADLQHDAAFRVKGEALKQEVLAHPALADYLSGLWHELLAWLQDDLGRPDSAIGARVAQAACKLGDTLREDTAMRQWINEQLLAAAPAAIDRWREDIRRYIVTRIAQWPADDLARELELHIGRDLQFVRINGTLVGGLIGLLIHAVTQALAG